MDPPPFDTATEQISTREREIELSARRDGMNSMRPQMNLDKKIKTEIYGIWAITLEWCSQAAVRPPTKQDHRLWTEAMLMIVHWVKHSGEEALNQAAYALCRLIQPDRVMQYIKRLLELMEQEYWRANLTSPRTLADGPDLSVPLRKEIFKQMREETSKSIGLHQKLDLRSSTFETQLSTTFAILSQLSCWTPFSSTRKEYLREPLWDVLSALNDISDNEEYRDSLRDFMKQHTAFCAFTLDNADVITTENSEKTAELIKNLLRLTQNLHWIALTKARQYERLYENFIAHRENLSKWLDSGSREQGRSLVDSFTDSLKIMASSMRREANFWKSQSNQFHKWPNIRQTYGCAIDSMPLFPSEQLNDHKNSTTPSIYGSVTQNTEPEPQRVPQAAQRVSTTFIDLLQKLRVNTTQAFLAKAENSISKRMGEARGYLEFVVDVAEKQLSQPAEECIPKVMVRLAEKALSITKQWTKLHLKVKYWGSFLSIFSKPCQTLPTFDMVSGISRDDFLYLVTATPDTLIHPYVIEFELCLRDMWHHFLSRTHFWARIDSDPATFTSWLHSVSLS